MASIRAFDKLLRWVGLSLATLMLVAFGPLGALAADSNGGPVRIQSVVYNAREQTLSLVGQNGSTFRGDYQMVRLNQPDRLLIDIPDAILSTPTRTLPVHQNGIKHVELSQSLGSFYQVVRLTVYGQSADALGNLKLSPQGNQLTLQLVPLPTDNMGNGAPPIPSAARSKGSFSFLDGPAPAGGPNTSAPGMAAPGRTVLQRAAFENGTLRLSAAPGQSLVIKNQFTLSSPSRLVIDLANAQLADKNLTVPLDNTSGPIRNVRLGQFDESTVRLVIETPSPNSLYLVYPGEDRSQLALSDTMIQSIRSLPAESQHVGTIQDIRLSRHDDDSTIRISTTQPMVRRLTRRGDQIEVELMNIAAQPAFVAYDKQEYPDIKEIRLSPLNAEEPNTKLIVKLDNSRLDMDSHLSLDGRTLEITMSPKYKPNLANRGRMPKIIWPNGDNNDESSLPGFVMPKFKPGTMTVVVDAGHGGKDLGANREGVLEKTLNLQVALRLRRALEAKGITVYMTRDVDKFLELSEICGITNRIRPDAFVSIHTNASINPSANGLETYYFTPQSRALAQRVHRRLVNSVSSPDRGVRTARFYVIHHTSVPAILVEMGYISNPTERAELQSEARQNATAEAVAQGVVEFLGARMTAQAP